MSVKHPGIESILIFGIVIVLILQGCKQNDDISNGLSANPKHLPYTFKIVQQGSAGSNEYKVVDLDGNGTSEILTISKTGEKKSAIPNFVTASDLSMRRSIFQKNFTGPIAVECMDLDENGTQEILVSEQKGNTIYLHIFNHKGDSLNSFPTVTGDPRGERQWDCTIQPIGMMDSNGDGRKDIVLRAHTGYAYQPRGIWVYDVKTGELLWSYPTGPDVNSANIIDIDEDGEPEILFGSNAPTNGVGEFINGTDDSQSYLFILNSKGESLAEMPLGGESSTVYAVAHDMDQNGQPEIVILKKSNNSKRPEKSFLGFWDFNYKRMLGKKEFEKQINDNTIFIDYNGDGIDEFLTFWEGGELQLRNVDNVTVQSFDLGEASASVFFTSDLNSDGELEIIINGATAIYVFSKKLELLAKFPGPSYFVQELGYGIGKKKGLFCVVEEYRYHLELTRNYRAAFQLYWPYLLSFLTGILLSCIFLFSIHHKRSRSLSFLTRHQPFYNPENGVITLDHKGIIQNVNDRTRKILDLKDRFLINKHFENVLVEEKLEDLCLIFRKTLSGELNRMRHRLTLNNEKQTSEVQVVVNPILDSAGQTRGWNIIFEDMTAFAQSRRAIAWSALAQRVAHQIKTPLSSVMLAVQRLQMQYQRDKVSNAQDYDKYINYVSEEVRRMREITDGFLKLARLEEPNLCYLDLNAIINNCLNKYKSKISHHIQIETNFEMNLPNVNVDEHQIQIALSVLFDNSFEAMDENGMLIITTRLAQTLHLDLEENRAGYVQIEIADTGCGITTESRDKLFEPFFTTKTGGTGLGLTIVKKIIEDHRGNIEIRSDDSIGTVVLVNLPVG